METPKYKTALIVGAGEGLSASLARIFAREKINIALAAFKVETTNSLNTIAGVLPNGLNYAAVIGTTDLRGFDGDLNWEVMPGWQIIAQGYKGRMRDAFGNPVAGTAVSRARSHSCCGITTSAASSR